MHGEKSADPASRAGPYSIFFFFDVEPYLSDFFHVFRLAGRAHRVFSHSPEFFSTFPAPVILPLDPVRGNFKIHRASDSAHEPITSLTGMERT